MRALLHADSSQTTRSTPLHVKAGAAAVSFEQWSHAFDGSCAILQWSCLKLTNHLV